MSKDFAPAFLKPRCKPNTPSPSRSPKPVSQADNTTKSKLGKDIEDISIPEINPNSESNIVIRLPSDAFGSVKFAVGDNVETLDVNDGVVIVKVPKLDEGNYDYIIRRALGILAIHSISINLINHISY
jgi:hypothetical protein